MTHPGWPLLEQPLVDHLSDRTGFAWTNDAGHLGGRTPLGIIQQQGGTNDLVLTQTPTLEVTLIAGSRPATWRLWQQAERAFAAMNPGPINDTIWVDEIEVLFGFVIDDDRGSSAYRVGTATISLTLRPQNEDLQP